MAGLYFEKSPRSLNKNKILDLFQKAQEHTNNAQYSQR